MFACCRVDYLLCPASGKNPMSDFTRRELLGHVGALGLGAAFLPRTASVVRAGESRRSTHAETPEGVVLEVAESGGLSHYSYFLSDVRAGVAAVIDPRRDVTEYLKLAEKHGVTITLVTERNTAQLGSEDLAFDRSVPPT